MDRLAGAQAWKGRGVMETVHVSVRELPRSIQDALRAVGYHRQDVGIEASERVHATSCGWGGRRAYFAIVNLETGERNISQGSWGGPNPYESPAVDQIHQPPVEIPPNGAAIKGYESSGPGYPCTATIYVRPETLAPMLPPAEEITAEELGCLYCYSAIRPGAYRTEYLARYRVRPETIDDLVRRGYLERNRGGATKITTKGKNTRGGRHPAEVQSQSERLSK